MLVAVDKKTVLIIIKNRTFLLPQDRLHPEYYMPGFLPKVRRLFQRRHAEMLCLTPFNSASLDSMR